MTTTTTTKTTATGTRSTVAKGAPTAAQAPPQLARPQPAAPQRNKPPVATKKTTKTMSTATMTTKKKNGGTIKASDHNRGTTGSSTAITRSTTKDNPSCAVDTTSTGSSTTTATVTVSSHTKYTTNEQLLIRQWLYEIELQQCDTELVWETMCARGIDTPTALVSLLSLSFIHSDSSKLLSDQNHHPRNHTTPLDTATTGTALEALHITSLADQQKVVYLIQRIQQLLILQQQQQQIDEEEEKEVVVVVNHSNSNGSNTSNSSAATTRSKHPLRQPQTHQSSSSSSSKSIPKENCHPSTTTTTASSSSSSSSSKLQESQTVPQRSHQHHQKVIRSASQLLDDVLSSSSSSSSNNTGTSLTTTTNTSSSIRATKTPTTTTMTTTTTNTTTGVAGTGTALPLPKLRSTTTTTTTKTIITPRASNISSSGVTTGSTTTSSSGISLRTGKQLLSSIPSESVPPMSPLVDSNHHRSTTGSEVRTTHPSQQQQRAITSVASSRDRRRSHSYDNTTTAKPQTQQPHRTSNSSKNNNNKDKGDDDDIFAAGGTTNQPFRPKTTTTTTIAIDPKKQQPLNRRATLAEKFSKGPYHSSERHLSSSSSVVSSGTTMTSLTSARRQSVVVSHYNAADVRNTTTATTRTAATSRLKSRMSYHPVSFSSSSTAPTTVSSLIHNGNFGNNNNLTNATNSQQQLTTNTAAMTSVSMSSNASFKLQIEALREETTSEHDLLLGNGNNQNNRNNMNSNNAINVSEDDTAETTSDTEMRIRVIVRKRPMTTSESNINAGDIDIIHPLRYDEYGRILVYQPRTRVDLTKQIDIIPFAFDNVYNEQSTNQQIYVSSIRHTLIPSFLIGQWASIFAYGQTGSGKTFTMMGNNFTGMNSTAPTNMDVSNMGLYYMAALDIFHALQSPEYETYSIHVSLFEIYGGKLYDLLNGRAAVKCLEDSKGKVCFPGLSDHPVGTASALMDLIVEGATLRSTGTTSRNADSSRSHAVLQLHLYRKASSSVSRSSRRGTAVVTSNSTRNGKEEFSRLTFIDLAGSERGADTSTASRATRLEGAEINTSLLALKEVIRALATGDSLTHVPFRGSKLTQVLKQSFVGKNCRSVMIACISPNIGNCEQTLNTLRYADRVKERNPETGELSPNMAPVTTTRALTPTKQLLSRAASSCTDQSYSSQKSDMLDELLASPPSTSDNEDDNAIDELLDDRNSIAPVSRLDPPSSVLRELIATHKDAAVGMLEMIQEEMSMVHIDNTNAQQFDQYLDRVYSLQEEQLSMITMLRELLSQYRSMNQSTTSTNSININGSSNNMSNDDQQNRRDTFSDHLHDLDNDDLFEDLRD